MFGGKFIANTAQSFSLSIIFFQRTITSNFSIPLRIFSFPNDVMMFSFLNSKHKNKFISLVYSIMDSKLSYTKDCVCVYYPKVRFTEIECNAIKLVFPTCHMHARMRTRTYTHTKHTYMHIYSLHMLTYDEKMSFHVP